MIEEKAICCTCKNDCNGWQVITKVGADNYVAMSPDMRFRTKDEDVLSDFDRLIESAPEEDKYKI